MINLKSLKSNQPDRIVSSYYFVPVSGELFYLALAGLGSFLVLVSKQSVRGLEVTTKEIYLLALYGNLKMVL